MGGRDRPGSPRPGHGQRQAVLGRRDRLRRGAEHARSALVDAAMPGMLPVPNMECIRQAVRTGMAIDAQINTWSRFDRKNYFYADLPQGYQISQLYHPLVGEGAVEIAPDDKNPDATKTIGVERIHVEQDAGKLMHDQHPTRVVCRPQPFGRGADGDRQPAGHAIAGRSGGVSRASCARSCAMSAAATATWMRGRCAPTSTSRSASRATHSARAPRRRTSTRCAS